MTTIEKISAGLPSRADWAMAALLIIAKLYRGERVHRYSGAHFDGRKRKLHYTAGISQAELVLSRAGIATIEGNDAPPGRYPRELHRTPPRELPDRSANHGAS